jgi:prephenate dehydrogenase
LEELIHRFAPHVGVKIFSSRFPADGQKFFAVEDVCKCDAVFFCCAIRDFEDELKKLLPLIPKTTVIVDVATVKCHTTNLLRELAGERPYIASHPMFGPESYKKTKGDVTGYRIVITDSTLDRTDLSAVMDFLSELGFSVSEMTPEEHDQHLANTLFLTHYIGQTMKAGAFKRTPIDSVSFGSLMNAVESVQHDEKLFHDVYKFNPFCKDAAKRFHDAQDRVFENLPKKP